MAFPTIPTGGRVVTGVQANATATRTFPDLSTLTKNAGDVLIAICVAYQASGTNASFGSWGGGFTELLDVGTSGSTMAIGVATKVSTGSETGTFTVTQAGTPTGHAVFILLSIAGANGATSSDITAPSPNFTTTTTMPSSGGLSPSWGADDTLWIAVGTDGETSTTGSYTGISTTLVNTNYGNAVFTSISADVVGGTQAAVAFRQLNAATETPGQVYSHDTSNARHGILLLAVRPTAPSTATPAVIAKTGSALTPTISTTGNGLAQLISRTASNYGAAGITAVAASLSALSKTGSALTPTAAGNADPQVRILPNGDGTISNLATTAGGGTTYYTEIDESGSGINPNDNVGNNTDTASGFFLLENMPSDFASVVRAFIEIEVTQP